jgi:histidine triad (HIT) family protein
MECLFCRIGKGEVPAQVIYEDAHCVAFLDIHPRAPGHAIVIPRLHAENLSGVPARDLGPLFQAVEAVTAKIGRALGGVGFTIGWNHGKQAGQLIDHLHIHIIPRFENDGGGSIHSVVDNPPKTSIQKMSEQIKEA